MTSCLRTRSRSHTLAENERANAFSANRDNDDAVNTRMQAMLGVTIRGEHSCAPERS